MAIARQYQTASLLNNGEVLIAGGGSLIGDCDGCSVNSAELYWPSSGMFSITGNMNSPRRGQTAVLLNSGKVLIVGGLDDGLPDPSRFLNSAEIYDPVGGTFALTGSMLYPRIGHTSTLLSNGQVLTTGGFITSVAITDTAELYDPATKLFAVTGNMTDARAEHAASPFNNSAPLDDPAIHSVNVR